MRHASGVSAGRNLYVLLRSVVVVASISLVLWSFRSAIFEPSDRLRGSSSSQPASHKSTYSYAPNSRLNLTLTLVVASLQKDDLSWLARDLPGFSTTIYTVDDPDAPLPVPKNKANEVMPYLTYIITHYDTLPDISIFLHAHQRSWHNAEVLDHDAAAMLRRFRSDRVVKDGYVNLRCEWDPGCPAWLDLVSDPEVAFKLEERAARASWDELHPGQPMPDKLAQPCCAQFAASRERLRSVPLEEWVRYREWVLQTQMSDQLAGKVWEYSWQWVLAGTNVLCQSIGECYCENYGVCFEDGEGKGYGRWRELQEKKRKLKEDLLLEKEGETESLEKWIHLAEEEAQALVEDAVKRGDGIL